MKNYEFYGSIILTVLLTAVIAFWVKGDPATKVKLAISYGALILLFLFGFLIIAAIASGKIDISLLLTESGGGASMSRFQLLIFTFVIALSFFLIVASNAKELPDIPANVLALLGVSATTYGVSKGIQAGGGLKPKTGPGGNGNGSKTTDPVKDGQQLNVE
jgi:L-lactate permease